MGSENLARLGESGLQRLEEQELTAEEAEHCADDADFVDSSGSREVHIIDVRKCTSSKTPPEKVQIIEATPDKNAHHQSLPRYKCT